MTKNKNERALRKSTVNGRRRDRALGRVGSLAVTRLYPRESQQSRFDEAERGDERMRFLVT